LALDNTSKEDMKRMLYRNKVHKQEVRSSITIQYEIAGVRGIPKYSTIATRRSSKLVSGSMPTEGLNDYQQAPIDTGKRRHANRTTDSVNMTMGAPTMNRKQTAPS
jgi:hypothetical protein